MSIEFIFSLILGTIGVISLCLCFKRKKYPKRMELCVLHLVEKSENCRNNKRSAK